MSTKTKNTKRTPATLTVWPTKPLADLTAVPVEADPEMVAHIQAHGIIDPLYVTLAGTGTYRVVDGARRLAAARAAGLETVPVTLRPVMPTQALAAHPGNVRTDLALTREFLTSIRTYGIRTPLKITTGEDGALIVGEGNRRLAAAIRLGLSHVPVEYDEVSEVDQYADMITTARHREGLTTAEEAQGLFRMAELGASASEMAAAAGTTQKRAKALAKLAPTQALTVVEDLEDAARLAAIEEADPELYAATVEKINAESYYGPTTHISRAERIIEARTSLAGHRAKLEAKGARIVAMSELGKKAAPVHQLQGFTKPDKHGTCQGDAWVQEADDSRTLTRYCTNTTLYGHDRQGAQDPQERRRTLAGNAQWSDATEARRQWIKTLVSGKHTAAQRDAFLSITVTAQLTGDGSLAKKRGVDARPILLAELLGCKPSTGDLSKWAISSTCAEAIRAHLEKTAASRRPAALLADWATCYELDIPAHVWRQDYQPPHAEEIYAVRDARRRAVRYLTTLQTLGYEPTPIEAAVIAGEAFDAAAQPAPDTTA